MADVKISALGAIGSVAGEDLVAIVDDPSGTPASRKATIDQIKTYIDAMTASSTATLTNKTIDAEGTGNAISNIDVANLKSGVLDTDISSVSGSDDTIPSAKAVKTYVDAQIATEDTIAELNDTTITSVGDNEILQYNNSSSVWENQTLAEAGISPVAGSSSITTIGTLGTLTVDNITIDANKIEATNTNGNIQLDSNGTGVIEVLGNTNDGSITLNCTDNSHGQTIKAQPHSAGITNTMLLPQGASSTLVSLVSTDTLTNKTLTSPTLTGTTNGANLTLSGDLTVNGTTSTINSTTLTVDDKNIEMGSVDTPTDTTANGGGITLKGATDKTIIWDSTNSNFTSNQDWNIASGKKFKINNADTLTATALGSAVVGSSLTSVGTIATGVWNGTAIAQAYIAGDAINGSKIADDSLDSEHYVDGSIDLAHISTGAKKESFIISLSDEESDLETGTSKAIFQMPYAFKITDIRATVGTAPVGSTLTVDINKDGSTILTTKLTIDASENTSTSAATAHVIASGDDSFADGAIIAFDIDQIGSSTAGKGLKIALIGYQT